MYPIGPCLLIPTTLKITNTITARTSGTEMFAVEA